MIDFSNIDKFSIKYDICNRYLRFCHSHIYYKEFRVDGQENIPKKGEPVFIVANHQNGLTDALVLLYIFKDNRQPVFIARGDIFKKDLVAKILHFLKILPTFRDRDGDRNDVRANNAIFSIASSVLNRGNTLAMFPEASHQAGNYLGTFKKGFPRIAFAAEEQADFKLGLKILPINIYYEDYYNFRSKVLITIGEPLLMNDFFDLYRKEPNQAYLEFNEYVRNNLKKITLDEGPEHFKEYDLIRKMLHKQRIAKSGGKPNDIAAQRLEDMQIAKDLDALKENDLPKFEALMEKAREYAAGVQTLKLRDWLINKKITLVDLLGKSLALLIIFPFFLFGLINNYLPFKFPELLKRKIKDRQLHSSMNLAPSMIITFPLMYLIWFILAWVISGKLIFAVLYVIAALISLTIYYEYKKAFLKWVGSWRYYSLKRKKNPLLEKLSTIKREIISNEIG